MGEHVPRRGERKTQRNRCELGPEDAGVGLSERKLQKAGNLETWRTEGRIEELPRQECRRKVIKSIVKKTKVSAG